MTKTEVALNCIGVVERILGKREESHKKIAVKIQRLGRQPVEDFSGVHFFKKRINEILLLESPYSSVREEISTASYMYEWLAASGSPVATSQIYVFWQPLPPVF